MSNKVNLKGALKVVKKAGYYLTPVFEAFTNALEAIETKSSTASGHIDITVNFIGSKDQKEFKFITIRDNGIGFTDTNFNRFTELFDDSKGMGNKGSGRLQFVHRFRDVNFESCYYEQGCYHTRKFSYGLKHGNDFIGNTLSFDNQTATTETYTLVTLGNLSSNADKRQYNTLTAAELKAAIISHYIVHLADKRPGVTIRIVLNDEVIANEPIKDIPAPFSNESFDINYQKHRLDDKNHIIWEPGKAVTLKATSYKFPKNELEKNIVALYSKGVEVTTVTFPGVIAARTDVQGQHYLTAISGELLDDPQVVNATRTEFDFPKRGVIEDELRHGQSSLFPENEGYIFFETLKDGIKTNLDKFYPELKTCKEQQNNDIEKIARTFCISAATVQGTSFDLSDDSDEKILAKLYTTESKSLAQSDAKIKQLYESAADLNPSNANYNHEIDEKAKELIALIPKQNAILLGKYVAHREFVARLLKLIVTGETYIQKAWKKKGSIQHTESLIHDLIFKRKERNTEGLNDLWILNEEFVHFDGCSDIPLSDIEVNGAKVFGRDIETDAYLSKFGLKKRLARRPDIFLFPGEGKCILVEFKAPSVDLAPHLDQISRYARLLANSTNSNFVFKQFYGYLLGENVDDADMPGDYQVNISKNSWFKPNEPVRDIVEPSNTRASLYTEVIKLSEIQHRALLRNKSFADKLGIRLEEF